MAIRVLAALRKEYVGASLLMIGGCNGGDECLLRTKALAESLGVSGFVEYTGKLTKEEWISRSEGCNVFINTTNFDNTPVSVIEAMALGFPIISTNVGGIPYIITDGDNGLLVNPNDVQGMVDCVRRLMDNGELCRQLSAQSVHTSQAYYSADVRKAWHLLLEDICK
jgi:glycosyltransferase involved in cell wall biosynthesis